MNGNAGQIEHLLGYARSILEHLLLLLTTLGLQYAFLNQPIEVAPAT